jgi:ArsR family transcriptional regulator
VRIRVLELLQSGPQPVADLLADTSLEASALSHQLAVLRRCGIVTAQRGGGRTMYQLAGPDVAELLAAARRVVTELGAARAIDDTDEVVA